MAHTHEHDENYFLDQIFTIALCGALGGIAVMLYVRKTMLNSILDQKFHLWVLLGGIGLLVMVAIRAMAVWRLAGQTHSHTHHDHHHHHDHAHHHHHDHHHHHEHADHDHAHGEHEHGHEHDHGHPHTHEHGHEHGWSPWRYTVLMLPVVLFFLNLPNEGLTARYTDLNAPYVNKKPSTVIALLASPMAPAPLLAVSVLPEDTVMQGLGFSELERAAFDPMRRKRYEGKLATLEGMLVARSDFQQFNIVRYRMNCCAADALPINAAVLVDPAWTGEKLDVRKRHQKWVRVTGRIYFFPKPNSGGEYLSALIVVPDKSKEEENSPNKLVEIIDRPENPYAN